MQQNKPKMGMTGPAGLQLKPKPKFGLQRPVKPPSSSVFGGRDDEDDVEGEKERANLELRRMMGGQQGRQAVQAAQKAALEQDASVYDYDGVYDQMKEEKAATRVVVGRPKEQKS